MEVYGIVINIQGFEPNIKIVEKDVYDWVMSPINRNAKIEIIPVSVFYKFEENGKYMKYFRNGTNELVKPSDYENFKAEAAPFVKDGFSSVEEAKKYAANNGYTYVTTLVKYLQS